MRTALRAIAILVGTALVLYGLVIAIFPGAIIAAGCLFVYAGLSKEPHHG